MEIKLCQPAINHCLLLVSLLSSSLCQAKDIFDLNLTELSKVEITGATLTKKLKKDIPAAVTVFTSPEIERLGITYLHELVALSPGFQVTRAEGNSYQYSITARGHKNGSLSQDILFIVDGRPVNNPRNGNQNYLYKYPINHIEKVEFIRGPGSAIYGSNAFTGVVNISTKKKTKQLSTSFASNNSFTADIHFYQQWQHWEIDGYALFEKDNGDSYTVNDTFSPNLIKTQDPFQQATLDLIISYNKTMFTTRYRNLSGDDFYNTGRVSNQYNRSEVDSLLFSFSHQYFWLDNIESKLALDFLTIETKDANQSTPSGIFLQISQPASEEPLFGYGHFISQRTQLSWQNDLLLNENSSVQFGLELTRLNLDKARGYTNYNLIDLTSGNFPIRHYDNLNNATLLSNETSLNSYAAYGQYQKRYNAHWSMVLGARYDKHQTAGKKLSPRASLIYSYNDLGSLKILYGEAFRAPSFAETSLKNAVTTAGNPNLKHEEVRTWDLIWHQQWQLFVLNLGLFNNHFENAIEATIVDGINTYINAGDEHNQGIEAELSYQPSSSWLVSASFTHLSKHAHGAIREARNTAALQLNYTKSHWNLNVSTNYNGARGFELVDTTKELKSYWLTNAKVSYQLTSNSSISLRIKNLFNSDYYTPSARLSVPMGIPNRSRELGVQLNYTF